MAAATHLPEWSTNTRAAYRAREDWALKWWIMFALILSVIFHMALVVGFEAFGFSALSKPAAPKAPDRVRISEELLRNQKAIQEIPETVTQTGPVTMPDVKAFEPQNLNVNDMLKELPKDQDIDLSPTVKEITNFIRKNDPGDGAPGAPKANELAQMLAAPANLEAAAADLAAEMASVRRDVLMKPVSEKQMLLDSGALDPGLGGKIDTGLLDAVKSDGTASAASARVKGFSNLDEILSGNGGRVGGNMAPILMPTDLLFEYGSDQLAETARLSLMKLGMLIKMNPDSLFIIEGHTDNFGGDDFNLSLSMRRAQAVVGWLGESLGPGDDEVRAVGMGKTKLIVPGGSVEEQGINRRVEIKVRRRQ